jgi:hypothetical protein
VDAGTLGAGAQEVSWDGAPAGGGAPASGVYQLTVSADGSLGVTSVSVPVTLDLTAPRLTVPAAATVTAGKAAKLSYTVSDKYSPTVKVSALVTDGAGASVGSVECGWVKQGAATCSWKAPVAGTYTLTFSAVDKAGNPQKSAAVTLLIVR